MRQNIIQPVGQPSGNTSFFCAIVLLHYFLEAAVVHWCCSFQEVPDGKQQDPDFDLFTPFFFFFLSSFVLIILGTISVNSDRELHSFLF